MRAISNVIFSICMVLTINGTSLAKDLSSEKQLEKTAPTKIATTDKPTRGMSYRTVERIFGPPEKILRAIGTPPISRWVYRDFTVYFESSYVIHTVYNIANVSKAN